MVDSSATASTRLPKCLLVVDAAVDPSVEKEWNEWYDRTHLPEILACPHFQTAARYVSEEADGRKYLTVYALDSEDAVKTPEFGKARGWAHFKGKVRFTTAVYKRLESKA